jgi:glycosyltransferase involved in cell wall biosynthesis
MISVILPAYERADAVLCCLAALEVQEDRDFDVFLVDDSASDAVRDVIWPPYKWTDRTGISLWYMRSSPPRVGSFTASRARNMGVANSREDLCVFVDQDVMLAPDAIGCYRAAYEKHGDNVVIVGLYHWLVNLDFVPNDIVAGRFYDVVASGLGQSDAFKPLPMGEPGLLGPDIREKDFSADMGRMVEDAALGCFGGNIGYPRALYLKIGGMDEAITGHGGEDADLGLMAKAAGANFLLFSEIWGAHRWHDRDQKKNAEEVQINIEYIDRKHGIGKYADAQKFGIDAKDWADWRHYQKAVGGVLMQQAGDGTIWVCNDGHRLGLPAPPWVKRLGFKSTEVLVVPSGGLRDYDVEGVCNDTH